MWKQVDTHKGTLSSREFKLLSDWTVLNGRCKEGVRYSEISRKQNVERQAMHCNRQVLYHCPVTARSSAQSRIM
jgi:hypothetical protein